MKIIHIILPLSTAIAASTVLSGCSNTPAQSQPSQPAALSLSSNVGKPCLVEFQRTNDTYLPVAGELKSVTDQWIVLSHAQVVKPLAAPSADGKEEWWIRSETVKSIEFQEGK